MVSVFDPAFIQAPEHRPNLSVTEAVGIPLIDLAQLHLLDRQPPPLPELEHLLVQVEAACKDWGFFQVINHGVAPGVAERAWAASRGFFALPPEEQRQVRRDEVNPLGYYEAENTKNVRDWKEVFDFVVREPAVTHSPAGGNELIEMRNQWPLSPPGFREAMQEYGEATEELAFKLLELIALTLNLPAKRLNGFFKEQTSFVRLNHYPPCPSPDLALGVGRHKDAGALTVLAQDDVGGLEVKRRSDGEWVRVKPISNSFIINVGDIIQAILPSLRFINDKYESAEHRVVANTERERFSIPFFFNPAHDVMVKPLEELIHEEKNPAKYEGYNWGEFFKTRNTSNFKKLEVENIQKKKNKNKKRGGRGETMVLAFEPAFIQSPEHRSKPADIDAGGIPLIDLAPLHLLDQEPPPPEVEALVAQVGAACREWGFFQAVNHGVPPGVMERAWAASKGFYALPPEERRRVRRDEVNPLGYYEAENTKNVRDWKEVFDFVAYDPAVIPIPSEGGVKLIELHNQWPQSPSGFKEAMTEYAKAAEELAFRLLELIALSLNLPGKRLHDFFKDQTSFVRLNHYPPCPSPDLALGVGRHKDGGAITILAQDEVGGLDVKRLSDGEWVRVKPIPNSFIINVGDLVQVWSNDRYESAEHRVSVHSDKERFSMPFFFNPAHYTMVKPLEELVDEKNPAKYEAYSWADFFKSRKNSNYKKLDEENVQIYHFKKVN
ncbi:Isopenicillin N synthase [Canna indica]|uniref:Isopenicillin N synthase n=1 Tax=Canna indica TaxID=4628 RepID=A0AAQ3KI66_9LILI|nr:Isopenicillin N synthase [Canna indica]